MFKLVIQDDEGKTTVVPLIRDEITIGRKEGNTIRLTERNVSRRHARIVRNNGEVHIEDLGSYNGIRVNNARIAERVSLRVSDQVQIGDYKLYLKAEGVEQVDDARTMPIERVDSQVPTEAMAAVTPLSGPPATQPMAAQTPPQAPQLIGNPNRTLVAIADTDHTGRPVATAATIATLQAPMGYGKLVVMSSNFAGKEFELSRPQMIIGRTDENDIVINHRSISRNHAKLVREPETGRYTISDLQSSNGVRVNGQDYGKVELRRGDMVDLGHVRLRFIEPGEDFVFARDAVITDVPEGSSRRGLVVVLALVLVVAAVVVIWATRGTGGGSNDKPENQQITGSNAPPIDAPDSTQVAIKTPGSAEEPAQQIDAPLQTVAKDDKSALLLECNDFKFKLKWQDLDTCAAKLEALGAAEAKDLRVQAKKEQKAEIASTDLTSAIGEGSYTDALKHMKAIGDDSVYSANAKKQFEQYRDRLLAEGRKNAGGYARAHDCKGGYKAYLKNFAGQTNDELANELKGQVPCEEKKPVIVAPPPPNGTGGGSGSGSGSAVQPPLPDPCKTMNVADVMTQAKGQFAAGYYTTALTMAEKLVKCQGDMPSIRFAALCACRAKNGDRAKFYYAKVASQFQSGIQQACLDGGIDVTKP